MAIKDAKEKNIFNNLKPQHQLFINNYIKCSGNATRAYIATYQNIKPNVAAACASRLLKNPKIIQAIDEAYTGIWKNIRSEIEKCKTYIMVHNISESDITDVVNIKNGTIELKDEQKIPPSVYQSIQSIEYQEKATKDGIDKTIKVKMHPKLPALKLRAEIQHMIGDKNEKDDDDIIVIPARKPKELIEIERQARFLEQQQDEEIRKNFEKESEIKNDD